MAHNRLTCLVLAVVVCGRMGRGAANGAKGKPRCGSNVARCGSDKNQLETMNNELVPCRAVVQWLTRPAVTALSS